MSSCLKHATFFCSLPLMTIMHHCNESILLSKPNHTMSLCISLLCTFSVCGIHMSQEGTSCTPIYQIFYMNYEFRTPTLSCGAGHSQGSAGRETSARQQSGLQRATRQGTRSPRTRMAGPGPVARRKLGLKIRIVCFPVC